MPPELIKDLKRYQSYLEQIKNPISTGVWKDITENLLPSREDLTWTQPKGKRKATKIYDSSAMIYLNIFVDGFHGNIINQATNWFQKRLPANLHFLEDDPDVRQWLQESQEILYFILAESNFYAAMRQYIRDGGSIGTASIYVEEDRGNGKIIFHVIHPREFFIAENQYNRVDVLFRKFKMTARQMKQAFGVDKVSVPVKNALEHNPFLEFDVIHAIYPNDEFDKSKLGAKYKPFASKWFEKSATEKDKFLRESGYDDFPFMTWRYFRGEYAPYGDSPAMYALPEIMGLQAISKTLLRAGHLSADPTYNIPSEMEGKAKIIPGGMNYYGPDFNRKITPVTGSMTYQIALDREEKKREILKEHYHVPYFLMLQQMDRMMTAREVTELTGEKAAIISASTADFMTVLDSILDYVGYIKTASGELPPPPPKLVKFIGNRRIPIEYMGPLAQQQKNIFETRGIMRSLEMIIQSGLLQIFPELMDVIDKEGTVRDLIVSNGFPQKRINSPEIIKQIREGRAMQQQEELRKIDMERMAETLKKLGQADKNFQGKMTEAISQMLGGGGAMPAETGAIV